MKVLAALTAGCVAAWLLQSLPTLTAPPTGAHAWRETDGLVVARNYCVEHAPFAEPRVDNRGETDGRTGLEFPILNWISGRIGCITGDYVTPWRAISLAFGCLLAFCLWAAARASFGATAALAAVICFATSPLTPYFSRTTQPDITAAALATAALAVSVRSRGWPSAAAAFALAAGAALVKLPTAVYLLPVFFFALGDHKLISVRAAGLAALALAATGVTFAWYHHARQLELLNGITNFGVTRSPAQLWSEWQLPKFWLRAFVQFPFDVWVFPAATAMLLGVLAWRRGRTPRQVAILGATVLAYIFLCGYSGAHHEYYGVNLLPALSLMVGWAAAELLALPSKPLQVALGALVAGAVAWQIARARSFWPRHQAEWASLSAFSRQEVRAPIAVFSDGSPQLFWFTAQTGRFADVGQPTLIARDAFAVVDRLRLGDRAPAIEAALTQQACAPVFENAVGWICRAGQR